MRTMQAVRTCLAVVPQSKWLLAPALSLCPLNGAAGHALALLWVCNSHTAGVHHVIGLCCHALLPRAPCRYCATALGRSTSGTWTACMMIRQDHGCVQYSCTSTVSCLANNNSLFVGRRSV